LKDFVIRHSSFSAMPPATDQSSSATWLTFALLTVVSWGTYGVFLHTGQLGMSDPANGRMKAFLFVGIAYFLVAVLAPIVLLVLSGANWHYPMKGMTWSLIAGIVGAIGALGVLLAFGAKGNPAVVMTIVFAGAPVVNAIVSLLTHPPAGGWGAIRFPFWLGMIFAVTGGALVTKFKPGPPPPKKPAVEQTK
jgi:drug/metabolite transporter (DMT)-like permease